MSNGPDLLERTRMALSDCGYDPRIVYTRPGRAGEVLSDAEPGSDDFRMAWRAVELASMTHPKAKQVCFQCVQSAAWKTYQQQTAIFERCVGHLPLTEDCGVDRSTR